MNLPVRRKSHILARLELLNQERGTTMKPMKTARLVLFAATVSAVWVNVTFSAETPFYRGKTLTVLINFAAGGPTDIEGRLVARFLGKHVPGQPTIVVQNMPGAGGVTGTNYLGEIAKPEGLMLGYFTSQFFNILTADPNLRVDLAKFAYRSEEHTSELQSRLHLVCRLLLEKKKIKNEKT